MKSTKSAAALQRELCNLELMKAVQLKKRYEQLFGEPCRSCNKTYLVRRIAWRLQANAEGGLTERAKRRIEELADDAEVRLTPPKNRKTLMSNQPNDRKRITPAELGPDKRLPPKGSCIQRAYKGKVLQVSVLEDGFELDGKKYKTLSAIAKDITGSHMNGFRFFKLGDAK
jgi:hypothetical protein